VLFDAACAGGELPAAGEPGEIVQGEGERYLSNHDGKRIRFRLRRDWKKCDSEATGVDRRTKS
jgi:hypothetical protein